MSAGTESNRIETNLVAGSPGLPSNLPAGAKAFQAAVDGKLTKDVWEAILNAQIEKAKSGDRGAAQFLLEYAGGVASLRGATFVQENHHHNHSHYHPAANAVPAKPTANKAGEEDLKPQEWEQRRADHAQRVAARVAGAEAPLTSRMG